MISATRRRCLQSVHVALPFPSTFRAALTACLRRAELSLCNETAPLSSSLEQQLTQDCNLQACVSSAELAGPWSECSATCGGGVQSQRLMCALNSIVVPNAQCGLQDGAVIDQVRHSRLVTSRDAPQQSAGACHSGAVRRL